MADSILQLNNERLQTEVLVCVHQHQVSSPLFLNLLSGTVLKNSLGLYFSLYCIGQGPSRALGSLVQALLAVQHN